MPHEDSKEDAGTQKLASCRETTVCSHTIQLGAGERSHTSHTTNVLWLFSILVIWPRNERKQVPIL